MSRHSCFGVIHSTNFPIFKQISIYVNLNKLDLTDKEKWDHFRRGDDFILSLIYTENSRLLYQYGLKFTSERTLVEDTIHDLFCDLLRNRKTIGTTDHIRFYLMKSFRRKLVRKINNENRYSDIKTDDLAFNIRYSVEQDFIKKENREKILKELSDAIENLTPRQKEAIYLRYSQDMDYDKISLILDMGIEASRNLVSRAVKSLKETLKENGDTSLLLFFFQT